jgi:hypothetical protein
VPRALLIGIEQNRDPIGSKVLEFKPVPRDAECAFVLWLFVVWSDLRCTRLSGIDHGNFELYG